VKISFIAVARYLADGQWHSGEELARVFGVTRSAIWYALTQRAEIDKSRRGYRLKRALTFLDRNKIQASPFNLEILETATSTNTLLLQEGLNAHKKVLVAEWQSQGRGRLGRSWQQHLGEGLMFSVGFRFDKSLALLSGLSLAVGVAIHRALKEEGVAVGLKWPNDLLSEEGKIGGILVETRSEHHGPNLAVIGVGLNVHLFEETKQRIDQKVDDLYRLGYRGDRNHLMATLLSHLSVALPQFAEHGFLPFKEAWLQAHCYQNREVELWQGQNRYYYGKAVDVGVDGALIVESRGERMPYYAGELSLRPVC
jgi:BirA family biotin operon repressor/biotin-[acetyl-CoA-carboxylase] ligase